MVNHLGRGTRGEKGVWILAILFIFAAIGCGWHTYYDFEPTDQSQNERIEDWKVWMRLRYAPNADEDPRIWECYVYVEMIPLTESPEWLISADSVILLSDFEENEERNQTRLVFKKVRPRATEIRGSEWKLDLPGNSTDVRCRVFYTLVRASGIESRSVMKDYELRFRKSKDFWIGY